VSWLKLDDGFMRNKKVFALSHSAFRLHVSGLCFCASNLTDGEVSSEVLPIVLAEARTKRQFIDELVQAGLWIGEGPWKIKDFLEYNPTRERVLEERAKARERMAEARWKKKSSGELRENFDGSSDAGRSDAPAQPSPSPFTDSDSFINEERVNGKGRLEPPPWLTASRTPEFRNGDSLTELVQQLPGADQNTEKTFRRIGPSEADIVHARHELAKHGAAIANPAAYVCDIFKKRVAERQQRTAA
jgi:hypothetical protein